MRSRENGDGVARREISRLGRFRWLLLALWTAALLILLAWSGWDDYRKSLEDVRIVARSSVERDIAYRRWNASMGGVYVPITEFTPPNPYLEVPDRDVVTDTGRRLTLVNPAYMTRQVHELMAESDGVKGHLTSLQPIRPGNAPDPWETRALEAFEQGEAEYSSLEAMDGHMVMRLMRPLYTEPACLNCHTEAQGYEVGDIRGGISVSVPFEPVVSNFRAHLLNIALGYSGLWLFGLFAIHGGTRSLIRGAESRARAEVALRESGERFRLLYEEAPVAYQSLDAEARVLDVNPAWLELLGFGHGEKDQVLGRPFLDFCGPGAREIVDRNFPDLKNAGEVRAVEYRLVRRDGDEVIVHLDGHAGRDADGNFERTHCILHNITELRRAETALREGEERYRDLVDNMSDGVAVYEAVDDGRDFVFREHNRAGERISGLTRDAVIGRRVSEVFPGVDGIGLLEIFRRVWKSGQAERIPVNRYQDERFSMWVENYIYRLPSGEVVAVYEDVTARVQAEEGLRVSEKRFRDLMEQSPVATGILSLDGRVMAHNKAFRQLLAVDETVLNRLLQSYNLLEDEQLARSGLLPLMGQALAGENVTLPRFRYDAAEILADRDLPRSGGRSLWMSGRLYPISGAAGTVQHVVFLLEDETEQKVAEDLLQQAAAVFRSTAEGVTITNLDGTILDVNQAFTDITGYGRDEVIGRNPRILQSGRHDEAFYWTMWQSLTEAGYWRGEIWNRRRDGTVYPELLTISAVRDNGGDMTGYVGVFADITAMKQSEERLEHLAHHDPLTNLPNRLLFNARLSQSIRHALRHRTKLAVVFVDLDRFKNINDSLGHPAGDELLKQLTERLTGAVRADDTVARISGDEFMVLLEDIEDADHGATAVRKLMQAFVRPFNIGGQQIRMTSSMGISLYPDDAEEASELLRNADAAMYRAKEEGRNTYQFYTPEMTSLAFERVFLENALRGALERGEFKLAYQPQVDLATGNLLGLEALLRWHHPEQGTIPPARFIPVAEQSGLILEIGAWVLKTACDQGRAWLDRRLEFGRIAVNVAGPQIQRGGFVELVRKALAVSGLPEKYLELELTEGLVMQRTEQTVEQLEALRRLGIRIAIDDFGTGYSSLSYLKRLPIDKLKIDQSFIREIPLDANDMAISEAVIALGRALGIRVIAEGVETKAQAVFLKDKGCQEAQGYLYGRPVPAAEMETLLGTQSRA